MTCQGRRHEPYWWVRSRCKGTTKRWKSQRFLHNRVVKGAVAVEQQCKSEARYGDYCYAHRRVV